MRRALGLRRPWRQKVAPFVLLGVVTIPAIVNVGIGYVTRDRFDGFQIITYREYVGVSSALLLFVALVAPDVMCPDRRHRVLPLMFARPLLGVDYVVAKVKIVAILTLLVIYVTMVYGPIAAMLVELFPTRIRYTSMSLPYHIGNGWFGGLLPSVTFAMVASNGNMYHGLWYPIVIAGVCFVIGLLFVKETKDVDIYARD